MTNESKTTVALTEEQYHAIIDTMRKGGKGFRANQKIATALVLEANLGIRISDILQLKLSDIVNDGGRHHLNIIEQKTSKKRTFTVPFQIYSYIKDYCESMGIGSNERIFDMTERNIQIYLKTVTKFMGLENIGTHSFRKFYATDIYNKYKDIELVSRLLQHSNTAITRKYITIQEDYIEEAIQNHLALA